MKLNNKVAVITGGNSGIGFGIAKELGIEGVKGAIVGRNQQKIDDSINELGSDFIGISADVTNLNELDAMYREMQCTEKLQTNMVSSTYLC